MKTNDIPEAEKSKLRLIKELPLKWHEDIVDLIYEALTWKVAQAAINEYLLDKMVHVKNISILFNSKFPVGPQRKKKR